MDTGSKVVLAAMAGAAVLMGIVLVILILVPAQGLQKTATPMGIGDDLSRLVRAQEQIARDVATIKRVACSKGPLGVSIEGCQ